MSETPYQTAFDTAIKELSRLMEERELLDTQRIQLDERIGRLREGVVGLSSLSGREWQAF